MSNERRARRRAGRRGQLGGLGGQLGGALVARSLPLQLGRDLAQPLGDLAQPAHWTSPASRSLGREESDRGAPSLTFAGSRSRTTAPRFPLMNLGASAPPYSLAISTASSRAASYGPSPCSIPYRATPSTLRSSGAMRSTVQPFA